MGECADYGKYSVVQFPNRISTLKGIHMTEKPTYEELEKKIQGLNSTTVELERVKRRIKAKDEFNDSLLNNSPHPIIVINPDTSVRYINPALEKLTGYSTEEILDTTTPYIWWTESTQNEIQQDFDKALQTGAKKLEELFIKKNGEQFWVEITSMPTIVNGKINYYLENWVDITQRKSAEASLLESEERFKIFSNLTFEGILTHKNGVIIDANRAATKILGYAREELIGENIIQLCVSQEYHATMKENIVKSFAKPYEVMARRKDGTLFPAEIEAKDIKKNNKTFRVAAIRDITERRQTEALLWKSEERYRTLIDDVLDSSSVGTFVLDKNFKVVWINQALENYFDLTRDKVIGSDKRQLIEKQIQDIFENPEIFSEKVLATYV